MTETSETNSESIQVIRTRSALDRLDQAFRDLEDQTDPSPRIFEIEVLSTLVEAETYLRTLEGLEDEVRLSLQDRLAQTGKDAVVFLVRTLEGKIKYIQRTGEPGDWDDWLIHLRRLDENTAMGLQEEWRKAQRHWENQTFFDAATQAYEDLKNEIELGGYESERIQYLAMEGVLGDLRKTRTSLEQYIARKSITDVEEFSQKKTALKNLIKTLEEDIKPYRKAHSVETTKMLDLAFGTQLAAIDEAEAGGLNFTYFLKGAEGNFDEATGNFIDDFAVEQSTKSAKEILYSRWNRFSEYKYRSYFNEVETRLDIEDPEDLEKYFLEKTYGTLRPIIEIDDPDLRANYKATKRRIEAAVRQKEQLVERIRLIVAQKDSYEVLRQLVHFRDEGTSRSNYLRGLIRDALDDCKAEVTKDWGAEVNQLRSVFKVDPKQALQLSQNLQKRLSGILEDDFKDIRSQKTTIETFVELCNTVIEVLGQVRHEKPAEARRLIEESIRVVEREGYALPEPLSDVRAFIQTTLNPLEQAHEILRDIENVYERDDVNLARSLKMEQVIALKSRADTACAELDRVQTEGKTIALDKLQETFDQLKAAQARLNRLIHSRKANDEIQRADADLRSVQNWLREIGDHPAYKAEAGRIQSEIQRLQRNDDDLLLLLASVDNMLDQKAEITELLSAFRDLEDYGEKPTTLRQELVALKNRLRVNLRDSIPGFLNKFESLPDPVQIKEAADQLEWLKREFPDYEGLGKIEGAICAAEALNAEGDSNWAYAWINWREAASYGREDALERAEACLKLWAITDAFQKKYGVLMDRALKSIILRNDEILNRFEVLRLLDEKKQAYQDPEVLLKKTESITDLNAIKSLLDVVGEGVDESDKLQYLKVWNQYGYQEHIGEEILFSLPTLVDLREDLETHRGVFSKLIQVAKKVRPENRLIVLNQGVRSANRWLVDLEGSALFKDAWDNLVDHVVLRLEEEIGIEGGE